MLARPALRASRLCVRCYATSTSTTPPLLLKIRSDMKAAMQNKDTNRLSVLRSIIAQALNASKTASPINTDSQMLALLRKTSTASRAAVDEFAAAGRQDLADKEALQVAIIEEYAGSVETVSESEIRGIVQAAIDALTTEGGGAKPPPAPAVLKKVFAPGVFGDKPVEKGNVAKVVKEMLAKPIA